MIEFLRTVLRLRPRPARTSAAPVPLWAYPLRSAYVPKSRRPIKRTPRSTFTEGFNL